LAVQKTDGIKPIETMHPPHRFTLIVPISRQRDNGTPATSMAVMIAQFSDDGHRYHEAT
jgi:hypothetical protein